MSPFAAYRMANTSAMGIAAPDKASPSGEGALRMMTATHRPQPPRAFARPPKRTTIDDCRLSPALHR